MSIETQCGIEPEYISVNDAAIYAAESEWTVRDKLRRGIYRAKKSGRRTLIKFATVKAHLDQLPDASFAPVSDKKKGDA
ncbi:hypothetical protein QA646_17780 [Rhizobium sp. CB3090]|uniref:hypothetical protein n=1 Tax=Rhizobium sp. CB3090 TaxID=3039156 RepID=UPI0024B0D3FA|nr:hypothetical protein [Rhizobium sp. CB3090]WFU09096.1 hypothetical protein QA646_17780 [Rhizobium sp. CB3090]